MARSNGQQQATTFRIIIVGGGIAGLAAAIALRQHNREIIVLEKSSMSREIGALLSLQPNAQKIVQSWNMSDILQRAQPTPERKFQILDINGEVKMNINMETTTYGADRMVYHRQDLHTALREAATSEVLPGPPAQVIVSSKVLSCSCEEGSVTLENGQVYQGDLVIGADGIHSEVRKAVLQGRATTESSFEPQPTGISAYRLLIETKNIPGLDVSSDIFDPQAQVTTLMIGYDKRVIMGPARQGEMLGLVALVPDERMHEKSLDNSWTTSGSLEKLLDTYQDFPTWIRTLFEQAPDIALWQLRDIDALPTWIRGRTILIGDAAHAMLPTQGQGASQSIEDAEALQAFFKDITSQPSAEDVKQRLALVFEARHKRASLIQAYSRQQARPGTEKGSAVIRLNPGEFMDYNCKYDGAVDWLAKQTAAGKSDSQ